MSTLLFALMRENPLPGLAAASLNVVLALCLVVLSLLLGITISMVAWVRTLVRRLSTVRLGQERRTFA
ncbi:hypothetical protein ACVMIH_000531 [Bradyrhizobium sp. USDA 4503]|uniref:hypothetical protein n=1 Tax=Bradyrhizobium TaxID=374 RepID=UPI00114310F3|nr:MULTISPECIES: hypothetical protein [Bradyrhizobium]MCC8943991.1 hypothetical protein [Bradyrhizobium brasilense]MCP1853133.1 hypothetical protein [Bradyrhizobium sp. USDA 4541]NLS71679.1 hypothetical protein [Bradyrhizobium brasilense]